MITKPTVLVLGAGASNPYGCPLGSALYYEVVGGLHIGETPIHRFLIKTYGPPPVRGFGDALRRSGIEAVDAFLEHNDQFLDIGRSAIAYTIAKHENESLLFPDAQDYTKGHWYRFLFNCLGPSFERFGENQLSVITFNYDRSLDHFLFTAMKHFYNRPESECIAQLMKIPIVHVHGSLGPLPWQSSPGKGVPFGFGLDFERIKESSQYIRIVHQASPDDAEFGKARELLSQAKRVYFMGFGYLPDNLRKLGLDGVPKGTQLRGTAFEMSPKQIRQNTLSIKYALGHQEGHVTLKIENVDCIRFLRDLDGVNWD